MNSTEFETVAVPSRSRDRILELIGEPNLLSKEDSHHYYRLKHGKTLDEEGYVPTTFDNRSSEAKKAIDSWIASKLALGYQVDFNIGNVACTRGRLTVHWYATEIIPGGTIARGCIDLSGKQFSYG